MSELKAEGGILRATISITRKATGKVETFQLVGCTDPEKLPALLEQVNKEQEDGSNA